jgi:hypothetical protein
MVPPTTERVPELEASPVDIQAKVASLLDVLGEDIRHLEVTLSRLDALRTALIQRDDGALERLLGDIRRQADAYAANEQRRQQLRGDLAAALGWGEADLTLSRLRDELAGPRRDALMERQTRLQSLTLQLKREHTLTALLIGDCARFNRSLLLAFCGAGGRGGMTYSPNGAAKRQPGGTLVSMQF